MQSRWASLPAEGVSIEGDFLWRGIEWLAKGGDGGG